MINKFEIYKIQNQHWGNKLYEFPIKRKIFETLKKELLNHKLILSIEGPRRVGKSVLMKQLINYLIENKVSSKSIFYFSFDKLDKKILDTLKDYEELDDVWKELNSIDEDIYYLKTAFPGINSDNCRYDINTVLLIIERLNKINSDNGNQWSYIVQKCLNELKTAKYQTLYPYGCDFGYYAQKSRDVNYCYFLEDEGDNGWGNSNYKSRCIESIDYIKMIAEFEKTGNISDCEKIPKDFYFKGYPYIWCLGRFSNKIN